MLEDSALGKQIRIEVEELAEALNGLIASFDKLKAPLVESHSQVPQATDQLDKISEQTEQAAQKMLDVVESITQREESVVADLERIHELASDKDAEIAALAESASKQARLNLDDAFTMLDALQFQDITSQQMDHAASLLEDIESKLNDILSMVGHKTDNSSMNKARKQRAYDPHADMYDKKTDQRDIDSLFEAQKTGES